MRKKITVKKFLRILRFSFFLLLSAAAFLAAGICSRLTETFLPSPAQIFAPTQDGPSEEQVRDEIFLPILMYHALVTSPQYQNTYFIDPSILESDLQYLSEHHYTTVTVHDLIEYVDSGKPLPEKPVMLTFDDGYFNNYLYAYPLLRKYHMKAVIAPVGQYTDQYSCIRDTNEYYAHLTWDHLREMEVSGRFEIQNHSYDLHGSGNPAPILQKYSETAENYTNRLKEDFLLFQARADEFLLSTPEALVYPYGAYTQKTEELARACGFRATLTCREIANRITRNPDCLYGLGRYLRSPDRNLSEILEHSAPLKERPLTALSP